MAWLLLLIPFVLGLALILVNRAVYYTASWNGYYCKTSPDLAGSTSERIGDAPSLYSTSDFCWPSGLFLVKGVRYKISLTIPEGQPDWFDYDVHTDVEGFPADGSYVHLIATPFKRWWSAYWFKPIARIGNRGNDEYMLNSV